MNVSTSQLKLISRLVVAESPNVDSIEVDHLIVSLLKAARFRAERTNREYPGEPLMSEVVLMLEEEQKFRDIRRSERLGVRTLHPMMRDADSAA